MAAFILGFSQSQYYWGLIRVHRFLLLFMCCMVLYGVANAATLCCVDVGTAQGSNLFEEHDGLRDSAPKPCHETLNMNHSQSADVMPDCECQNCLSFNGIFYQTPPAVLFSLLVQFEYTPHSLLDSSTVIYYPPRFLA